MNFQDMFINSMIQAGQEVLKDLAKERKIPSPGAPMSPKKTRKPRRPKK